MFQRRFLLLPLVIILLVNVSCNGNGEPTPPTPTPTPINTPFVPATVTQDNTDVTVEPTIKSSETSTSEPEQETTEVVEPTPTEEASPVRESIIVGSKQDTEQMLLGKMLVFALQQDAELEVEIEDQTGYGDTLAIRQALEDGEIDLYWESTGTAISIIHGKPVDVLRHDPASYYRMAKSLDEPNLIWLGWLEYNNTYTLMVEPNNPTTEKITTIEELASLMNARLCVTTEFQNQEETGLAGLQESYGFSFQNVEIMEQDQIYESLRDGKCDVAVGHSTDAQVSAWKFVPLEDTRDFFPFYNPATVIRPAILEQHERVDNVLANLLTAVAPRLNEARMSQLNACVELGADGIPDTDDEPTEQEVVHAFLQREALECLPKQIAIGSKQVDDNVLLGQMLVLLLEGAGYDVLDKTNLGPSQEVREALETGQIDVQWETINTALTLSYGLSRAALHADPNAALELVRGLDQKEGLIWLDRIGNVKTTYALMMPSSSADEPGIETIEDLANFIKANGTSGRVCVEEDFAIRSDGLLGLQDAYGFKFQEENIVRLSDGKTYDGLRDGRCEVAQGFTTGSHEGYGFKLLEDNKGFFLPLIAVPVIRQEILDEEPLLADLLESLVLFLDGDSLTILNSYVTVGNDGMPGTGDEQAAQTVARNFLCTVGLITDCPTIVPLDPDSEPGNETTGGQKCEQLVLNGSFENEEGWEFPPTSGVAAYNTDFAHSGERMMQVGLQVHDDYVSHSVAKQLIQIPAEAQSAKLSYFYYPISNDSQGTDEQGVLIYSSDETFIQEKLLKTISNEQAWVQQEHDLSDLIGEEIYLYLYLNTDGDGRISAVYFDDVSLEVCSGSE